MVRVADFRLVDPGSNPGSEFFFLFFSCKIPFIFCANSTHTSTHASNLRKFANPYNARKFDAHSAHVVVMRRYCAK